MAKIEEKAVLVTRRGYTHEIRDAEGEWIWLGDESSMSIIFHNITGRNFAGQPAERHLQYMEWVSHFVGVSWPGRANPFEAGSTIELAEINEKAIERHTFPSKAMGGGEAGRGARERKAA